VARVHDDEVRLEVATMRAILRRQAPQWADLDVRPVPAELEGTDHTLFRIGPDLLARMPKVGWAADQAASDARWLPHLAPHLDVDLPVPVLLGEPDDSFPFPWSVTAWLPGHSPGPEARGDVALAEQLAAFVVRLHSVPSAGGPAKAAGSRGTPLGPLDPTAQEALRALSASTTVSTSQRPGGRGTNARRHPMRGPRSGSMAT
jgi:aminoglycoside phosphotransferase (APT) family kinase protein